VSVDNIKDIIGSQLIVPRRGTGHESPACVESLQSDSNVKSALCSLASTKTIMERRPSYSNLAEESSFLSRKRAHSLNGSCDSLDQHRSHAASAAFAAARRPRRRPIDPFRELIVLVPGDVDDQIRKMGLTPAEIPEFLLCLEEQVDYDEEGDEEEETANGRHEEKGAAVVVPSIKMEVYTPTVRINQFYEARQKKGCGFNIRSLAPQISCCHYDEYEADSEDEKFLTNLDLKYEELSRSVKSSKAFLKGEVKGTLSKNHSLVTGEKSAGGAATAASELEERSNQLDKNEKQKQNSARHHTSDSSLGLQIESDGGNDDGDINRMDLQVDTVESSGLMESTKSKSNAVEIEPRSSMVFVPESVFQRMFAALERELEVAKGMESLLKETKTLHTKCAHLLEHSKTASELIETFLAEDSDDDSDIEKQKKKGKENKGGEEKNLDSIRSLEELILASKREQKLEEEELARPSLISHATSLKVDGKDIKIEGKEGEVKVILKRGRPLGRVGDKAFPSDSGGGGGAGLFGLNSSNRNSTGTSSTGGSVGAGGVVVAVVPRRGRPPLSKTRGREKDSTAIPTPIATTMNLNTSAGTTSLSTSTTYADSLPFSLPSTCSQLSSPHTDSTSATTFTAPFSSCIIVSPTAHTSSNLNGPMSVEGDCIDNANNSSNNTHSGDVVRVANGRSSSIDHGHESDTDVTVRVTADDERCRTDRHGDNNDSSSNSNSAGNRLDIDFSIKKEGTSVEGDYYSTFTNMTNIRSANNVTFSSDVEGETSNKSSLSRNESKDASKSLDGKKDKVTLETDSVYTETQLKSFVSDTRGLFILRKFYSEIIRKNDDTLVRKENEENKIEIETDKLLLEVYEFWIKKRSGRFSSLLRCYHNFIMKKWGQQEALPPLPEDVGGGNMLKNGYTELLKLRLALEKARILADRVRRREKLKRDLLKLSGEHLDSYFSFLARGNSSSNSKNSSNIDIEVENEELDEEGEIPCSILGKFGTSVLLPFSLEPGNYDVLYEREREKLALNASLALSLKSQEHAEQITERSRERTGSISVLTEGRDRTNSITVHARDLTGNGHGATHWSIEDDRLLLLGVAACGVGRWSEIRSEFELSRNSSQMNQRFTRLIRRRIAGRLSEGCEDSRGLIHAESTRERERENGSHGGDMSGCSNNTNTRNNSSSSSTGSSGHSHGHGESNSHQSRASHSNGNDITSSYDDDDDHHNETVPEATDLTAIKRILPQSVRLILDCYEEISVWESIAVRYLLDTQNHEKRSGRPVLHPLPIPIPVHLLKGKHVLFLHKLIERPSSVQSNKIQTAAKVIPKSHKKAIPSTTSSSTLKFIPMVGAADSTHENGLGGGGGGHGSVNYDNYMNNNNTVKSVSHPVVAVPSSSTLSTAAISDYSPEKKSKSKNRKRDRNREKEKRREKDKLRNEVEKRERAMREKEIGDGDIHSNAAVMPSSTVATAIIIEKNKKNISGFSTADSSIIHGNLEIMGKRVRSNDIVKKEENDDLAVVSSVNDSEKGSVKGVSRRTRSNHTESGEIFEMLLIPIVKKVEKVKENGEKRSHKKKKVEPKVAVCTSLLPSALPTSLPSILPLPCFSSLSYPIQSSILPLDSISPTCITACAEEDNDVIVMMIVDNNTTAVTPQEEEEVEEEEVEDLKEVEIEVVRPSWHSKALSFLGIRCEKDKDDNALKIAEEKRRLCVSGEIVRERERSVTANNEELFSIVPNISSEGLADEMECFDGKVEKERERLGESASGILKDVHFVNNDKGDREGKEKDKKKECKKRVRHDVCNGDE
jgi:hypothetical protein